MRRVSGVVELSWTVEIPDGFEHWKEGMTDDPAIMAVLDFISQMGSVYCFGEENEPAKVFTELHEEDFEIEEDDLVRKN